MVMIDCPWCEAPVPVESMELVRCERCSIVVELAAEPGPEVALAA